MTLGKPPFPNTRRTTQPIYPHNITLRTTKAHPRLLQTRRLRNDPTP